LAVRLIYLKNFNFPLRLRCKSLLADLVAASLGVFTNVRTASPFFVRSLRTDRSR
jgi:hypothetical protein